MEIAIIIVLAFMLLISIIILIDINFDRKEYKIRIQDCASALDKSKKENQILKNKNADFKNQINDQELKFNKLKKSNLDLSNSKLIELEIKYKSSLHKINERDEKIRDRDLEIIKLEKTKKEYSQRVFELHGEKQFAIHQSKSCIKLCNEMSIRFKSINSELEAIETELLRKLNP